MFSVLELIGFLIGVPSFIGCLYAVCLQICKHWYAFQDSGTNFEKARVAFTNLRSMHNALSQELRSCRESLPHSAHYIASPSSFDLARFHLFIKTSWDELKQMKEEYLSRSYVSRFFHSTRFNRRCLQLEALGNRLVDCAERMRVYCALALSNANHDPTSQRYLDNLRRTGYSFESMIERHEIYSETDPSAFGPFYGPIFQFNSAVCIVQNPLYVVLDFDGDTPEKTLKNRILCHRDEIHDIFMTRKLALEGRKGAGKTCILNGLHTCRDIRDRFVGPGKGGIYNITVGPNPDFTELKRQMSKIVETSGGWHLRERILQENISAGILVMAEWFMHKDTLFLVDGLDNSPLARAFEDQLELLSRVSDSSVVVFSRRVTEKSSDEVVHVPAGNEFQAEWWLLRLLEMNPRKQMKRKQRAAFNRIIAHCNREKRLLGQVSVCYKLICQQRNESRWEFLAGRISVLLRERHGIEVALTALLLDLMKSKIDRAFPGSQSIQRLYRAFHIVRIKEWVPLNDLRREWNLGEDEALTVQQILVEGRLCQVTERVIGNVTVDGMEADGFWWDSLRKACLHEVVIAA